MRENELIWQARRTNLLNLSIDINFNVIEELSNIIMVLSEKQAGSVERNSPSRKSMYPSPPDITSMSGLLKRGKSVAIIGGFIGTETKNLTASL